MIETLCTSFFRVHCAMRCFRRYVETNFDAQSFPKVATDSLLVLSMGRQEHFTLPIVNARLYFLFLAIVLIKHYYCILAGVWALNLT